MSDSTVQPDVGQPGSNERLAATPAPGGHRIHGWILIGSAALAVTGNVLHPRSSGDVVEDYRMIAGSIAWPVATLLIGIALVTLVIGLVPICRSARPGTTAGRAAALDAAGWALVVGGTIGVAQQGVDGVGLPRQAAAFTTVEPEWNAFPYWSADAVAAINSSLAVIWYVLVLGLVPVLLAVAYRGPHAPGRVVRTAAAGAGILTAATVAVITIGGGNGVTDTLFLAGSLLVTGWFVVLGVTQVRDPRG